MPQDDNRERQGAAAALARDCAVYAPRRILKPALLIGGLTLAAWLIVHVGAPAVGATLHVVGWTGLLAISGVHLIATALMGWAWWGLQRAGRHWVFMWARLVRDAGSEVLPLSQIGGYVLGARAVTVHGVASAAVIASTVVDTAVEFCSQIAFTAFGLALLLWLFPDSRLVAPVLAGLGVAIVAAAAFIAVQRRGSDFFMRVPERLMGRWFRGISAIAPAVQSQIRDIYRSKRRVWWSFLLHFGAWTVAAIEAWLALRFMGASISLPAVLTIETLLFATRAVAFMVPGAVGVQEGAYIMLGVALGLTPDLALGLSLLKRGRDLVLGVPSLVSWQLFENRKRLRTHGSTMMESAGDN